jgi:hypothetical protein
MKKLEKKDYQRAQEYLLQAARPLEKAVFKLEFNQGGVDDVLIQLEKFQNPDGGFGKALEPDLRTPTSSALCTEMALRYMLEWKIPVEHPMIGLIIKYLLDAFDAETQVWRVVPQDANDYPHAPWWHDDAGSLERTFDGFLVIPRAGILASLYHVISLVDADWLAALTEKTVADIENLPVDRFGGGGDTLVYALRLADTPGLESGIKVRLRSRLRSIAEKIVTRDPQGWSSYATSPLKLAPSPKSSLSDLFADEIQANLDYVINQQSRDGSWEPTWSWGDSYPDTWEQVRREWSGILTLDTLITLRAYNRLEI